MKALLSLCVQNFNFKQTSCIQMKALLSLHVQRSTIAPLTDRGMCHVKLYENVYGAVWGRKILWLRIQAHLKTYLVVGTILPA